MLARTPGMGYIHFMKVTAANVNERDAVRALIREDNEVVYGNAEYSGIEKRQGIKIAFHPSLIKYRVDSQKPYRKKQMEKWTLRSAVAVYGISEIPCSFQDRVCLFS